MAPPMAIKMRWLKYLVLFGLCLFLFNKTIVFHYLDDVWRSRVLRFQLSCFLQTFYSLMGGYVWWTLSPTFDHKPKDNRELTFANFFTLDSDSLSSKVWKTCLAFILLCASGIYLTFGLLQATEPYVLSYWVGLCWGFKICLFAGVVLVNVVCFIIKLCGKKRIANIIRPKLNILAILYAILATTGGFYNAAIRPPAITEVQIPVKELPTNLEGMTITFLPDIHLGPTTGRSNLEKIVHMVNYLQSDVVIIGGDLVDGRVNQMEGILESLEWISPKYGLYFVTGNHEYYTSDVLNWFLELESRGVKVLHNSHVWLPSGDNKGLCLAGVSDPQGEEWKFKDHVMDLDAALSPCGSSSPVLLVSHRPSGAKAAFDSPHRVDLVLAGHTHGGQMFPINVGTYLSNPYYAGLYKHGDDSHVYVSMGTRFWGFPIRVGTRSEITHITLTNKE